MFCIKPEKLLWTQGQQSSAASQHRCCCCCCCKREVDCGAVKIWNGIIYSLPLQVPQNVSAIFQLQLLKGANPQLVHRNNSMRLPFVLSMGNKSISPDDSWHCGTPLPQKAAIEHGVCHFWTKSWWQGKPRSGNLHLNISEFFHRPLHPTFPARRKHMSISKCVKCAGT